MNTTPFAHQLEAADFIDANDGRGLLAIEMGGGKSFAALIHAARHPEKRPIIIVCPATLKPMWERECLIHFNWRAEVVEGVRPHRTPLPSRPKIVIVNYDILHAWLPLLQELKPQIVILDESSYIGSRSARRTKMSRLLCQDVPHVLALSGTPLTNRPAELWPTLNILAPKQFDSFYTFAHRYAAAKRTPWGWDFSGASHLDELHAKLSKGIMFRKRKEDILDLPAKRRSVIPMKIADPKEYQKASEDFLGWMADRMPSKLKGAEKAHFLTKVGYLKRLAAQLKLPAVFDWLDSFLNESDEKLICFGIHRESIVEKIHARYANSVIVTGQVTGKKRQLAIDKFLRDKKCRLFIGNIDAAGIGWSAKGVSNVAFVECAWSPGKHTQAEDRTHGIGRGSEGKTSHSYYLVGQDTIEMKLADILQKKQRNLNKVLDGGEKGEDLNLFDLLVRQLGSSR